MRKPALTSAQKAIALERYEAGLSMAKVADELGVSERTIFRVLHDSNVTIRRQGRGTLEVCSRGHSLEEYGRYQSSKDNYGPCKECNRIAAQESRQRRTQTLQAIKVAKGCKLCGYNRSGAALDFHHRDSDTKSFSIGAVNRGRQWEEVLAEIEKCDVLCSNCHRELHESEIKC